MKVFSAKKLHDNPSEVYRAANREPVVITHRHHGRMILRAATMHEEIEIELTEAKEASE